MLSDNALFPGMDLPTYENVFKDEIVEDFSGFTGDLLSSSSESASVCHESVGDDLVENDDEDETSSGQDGFNEVGEVLVRFKPCERGSSHFLLLKKFYVKFV